MDKEAVCKELADAYIIYEIATEKAEKELMEVVRAVLAKTTGESP